MYIIYTFISGNTSESSLSGEFTYVDMINCFDL